MGDNKFRQPHPHTASIFTKAEIYFASPSSFNDPYDCNLKLHFEGSSDKDWHDYLDFVLAENPRDHALIAKVQKIKREKAWSLFYDDLNRAMQAAHYNHYHESSVFCLSLKPNSIPMFSYYADSHSGIAIELKFTTQTIPCGVPIGDPKDRQNWYDSKILIGRVRYYDSFPDLNFLRLRTQPGLLAKTLFATKHSDWSHEQEVRIFRLGMRAAPVSFEQPLITGVILGSRTTENDLLLVKSWLKDWPTDIILSKAEQIPTQFNLNIKYLETIRGKGIK
jgi:hypothetical protein